MANIENDLKKILDAVYGEEVRSSIYNALAAINSVTSDAIDKFTSMSNGFTPKGTIYFENLPSIEESNIGDLYLIYDSFVTTNDFESGSGIQQNNGTRIYLTANLKWDVFPISTSDMSEVDITASALSKGLNRLPINHNLDASKVETSYIPFMESDDDAKNWTTTTLIDFCNYLTSTIPVNTSTNAGLVSSGANQVNKVWMTDNSGNPDWRNIPDASTKVSKTGDTVSGTLVLSRGNDAAPTAYNSPALVIGGTPIGQHIEIDSNEILAKKNMTTISPLYLNDKGGEVYSEGSNRVLNSANFKSYVTASYIKQNSATTIDHFYLLSKTKLSNTPTTYTCASDRKLSDYGVINVTIYKSSGDIIGSSMFLTSLIPTSSSTFNTVLHEEGSAGFRRVSDTQITVVGNSSYYVSISGVKINVTK